MKQLLLHTINGQAYSEKDVMETEVTRYIWEGGGRVLRRVVAVLLVLVMLGSAVMPAALAAGLDTNVTIKCDDPECSRM